MEKSPPAYLTARTKKLVQKFPEKIYEPESNP
jgi:hypothetical protein